MSFPPPYRSGHRVWRRFSGLERAAARFGGVVKGFIGDELVIVWPAGEHRYPVKAADGCTEIELQLKYDLEP